MAGDSDQNYYRFYSPSLPAAIVFAVLYGLTCIATVSQYFFYRSWFWFFAVLAGVMEAVGYVGKAISASDQTNRTIYILQFVLVLLAPAVLAASCYMCMGRIALYVTPPKYRNMRTLWVVPRFMTLVFVLCDVVAFLIQALGGVMAVSTNPSTVNTGFNVLKVGLAVQIIAFGFFLIISFRFHIVSRSFRAEWPDTRWTRMLWAINAGSTLIFIRSVYRMIEFSTGSTGYLNTHEWNFYVFESGLIIVTIAIFNVFHPAQYLTNIGWKQTDGQARTALEEVEMGSGGVAGIPRQDTTTSHEGLVRPAHQ